MSSKLLSLLALTQIDGVGGATAKTLLSYCGSAEEIFKQPKSKLLKIPGIGEKTAKNILSKEAFKAAEEELKFIEKYKIQALAYYEENYPHRLKECKDAPALLYYKGAANLNSSKIISIVGTRKATKYADAFLEKFFLEIQGIENMLILSGMAYGVDIKAHKLCLNHNIKTIGVLGHGLQTIYPADHKKYAKEIIEQGGGLLTEFSSQDKIVPGNFPARNRIIAGMSDAVIVVESGISGGAVITANIANSYNREVFAVPGAFNESTSAGCNFLIKSHKAHIIENADDLCSMMNWTKNETIAIKKEIPPPTLSSSEQKIYDIISAQKEIEIDKLTLITQMNSSQLAESLLMLELQNIIKSLPGKRYTLC